MTPNQAPVNIAILDDYQNVALKLADWSSLQGRAYITVFNGRRRAASQDAWNRRARQYRFAGRKGRASVRDECDRVEPEFDT